MYSSRSGSGLAGHGLGWWQAALKAIPATVAAFRSVSGGDSKSGDCWGGYNNRPFAEPCPNTPNFDAVVRAVEAAPDAEIQTLIAYLLTANSGKGPKSRAALGNPKCVPFWVKAIMGGKGCVASTYPEAPGWFISFVQEWGAPITAAQTLPGSAIAAAKKPGNLAALAAAGLALVFLPKFLGFGK